MHGFLIIEKKKKEVIVRMFGPKERGIGDGGIRFSISKNITRGVKTIEISLSPKLKLDLNNIL